MKTIFITLSVLVACGAFFAPFISEDGISQAWFTQMVNFSCVPAISCVAFNARPHASRMSDAEYIGFCVLISLCFTIFGIGFELKNENQFWILQFALVNIIAAGAFASMTSDVQAQRKR